MPPSKIQIIRNEAPDEPDKDEVLTDQTSDLIDEAEDKTLSEKDES